MKFYKSLELIRIYAKLERKKKKKTTTKNMHKQYKNLFVKCNLGAESQACATDLF